MTGSWKTKLRVADLAPDDRLEIQCRKCGQVRFLTLNYLLDRGAEQLFLDEIEGRARCRVFGCGGKMRMAMLRQHKMSAFIGGIP